MLHTLAPLLTSASVIGVLALLSPALSAEIPAVPAPPEIQSVQPAALQPGATHLLRIRGRHLEPVRQIWTSWQGPVPRAHPEDWESTDRTLKIPLHIPPDLPPGMEKFRLIGPHGVSHPFLVLIDPLPSEAAPDSHHDPARAHPLAAPVAIDATLPERRSHFYRVPLQSGQSLSLEVVAQRLGSPLDPVLRILDPDGHELRRSTDTPGLGYDCAVTFQAPVPGDYLVEIRDAEYAGGNAHRYRLRAGSFPVAVQAHLPGLSPSDPTPFPAVAPARTGVGPPVVHPGSPIPVGRWLPLDPADQAALTPRLPLHVRPPDVEIEPNDDPDTATPLHPDTPVRGHFHRPDDQDWYRFEVHAPGFWRLGARARELGYASDPLLRLLAADGSTLATSGESAGDPAIHHRFQTPGTYHLAVEEAGGRTGPHRGYVAWLQPAAAPLRFTADTDRLHVPVNGTVTLRLELVRHGYDGPIRLEPLDWPPGINLRNPVIDANRRSWDLEVQCNASVSPGSWTRGTLRAHPVDQVAHPAELDLSPARRKLFPRLLHLPPGFLTHLWIVAVPALPDSPGGN
ncbi:MAG: PPC domain-containing protein [Verrucomicrobiae bacterium]|nr:PPC domain-containing protein [Verrucomicrobiae bacterium]